MKKDQINYVEILKIYNDPKALNQLEAFREGASFANNPKTQLFDFGQTNSGFNPNSAYDLGGQSLGTANRYDNLLPNSNNNQRYF